MLNASKLLVGTEMNISMLPDSCFRCFRHSSMYSHSSDRSTTFMFELFIDTEGAMLGGLCTFCGSLC